MDIKKFLLVVNLLFLLFSIALLVMCFQQIFGTYYHNFSDTVLSSLLLLSGISFIFELNYFNKHFNR